MITNERQYRISKAQLNRFMQAVADFDLEITAIQYGSKELAQLELDALNSEIEVLEIQLKEYERLRSGEETILEVSSIDELPRMLIKARIAKKLSQKDLAERVGLKEQQIQRYEAEEYMSASIRRLKQIADALDLQVSGLATIGLHSISSSTPTPKIPNSRRNIFRVMFRRGYFGGESDTLNDAIRKAPLLLESYLPAASMPQGYSALHRKKVRSNKDIDEYALAAWEKRVITLAAQKSYPPFSRENIDSKWITQLVQRSKSTEGPRLVKDFLFEVGISFVIEPQLPGMFLDGAALLFNNTPVIALSIRYDRIDNFWFTLLHELFHVLKHLQKGELEGVFDDLDDYDSETIEREADELAREALLPINAWKSSIARLTNTPKAIRQLANQLNVSPAIIAGRIRYDKNEYFILNDLIGQGEIRKLFPEINFE